MGERDDRCRPWDQRCRRLRPLDEGDRVGGQVVVEERRILGLEPVVSGEAMQVEMRDRDGTS
ncbi:MAG: hypothetical protein U0R51_14705 [Solirubrobacterales bacterium]